MNAAQPVALITGANRGLGKAIASAFAKKGYFIGLHYFKDRSAAEKTQAELMALGAKSLILSADVRQSNQVNQMVQTLVEQAGRIDVLVNNAGNVRNRTVAKMSDEEWRDVMSVNLDGPFYVSRAVIPHMRKGKGGAIVNMVSYLSYKGIKGAANYAAAKAGLITLTKTIAQEEGVNGIRANAFMPGFHVTDINRDVWGKSEAAIRAQHLLPEMPNAQDMADFLIQIAELKAVTGQVFSFESRLL